MFRGNPRTVEVEADSFGEIHDSYSGDRLVEKVIRKPFKFESNFYVSTGGYSKGDDKSEECYLLVRRQDFKGEPKFYGQKLENVPIDEEEAEYSEDWAAQRRSQPEGFYHGMLVKRGGSESVLVGPPIVFVQKAGTVVTKQLSLF
jgi:hypothetical protein